MGNLKTESAETLDEKRRTNIRMRVFSLLVAVNVGLAENCDTSGADAAYTETILSMGSVNQGTARRIVANGCPNHVSYLVGSNPNNAEVNNKDVRIQAYPCFADVPFDVTCVGSAIGVTLNGGISIYSKYAGGTCDAENDAVALEGDTFDSCSGHSAPGAGSAANDYHYHVAPSCLLAQLNDTGSAHSPQIGWAYDGFPIFGPNGVDGQAVYGCSHGSGNATDCLDTCNGHDQHEIDGFLYHYHITGPVGDLVGELISEGSTTRKLSPLPSDDMSPYTIGCLVGVPVSWNAIGCGGSGADAVSCNESAVCSSDGTSADYTPVALNGVTNIYTAPTSAPVTSAPVTGAPTPRPSATTAPVTAPPTENAVLQMKASISVVFALLSVWMILL